MPINEENLVDFGLFFWRDIESENSQGCNITY
jgi:hypothetical protein